MYPVKSVYSHQSYLAWKKGKKVARKSSKEIRSEDPLDVRCWDDLREAVSFLSLMNKRQVLYFRGQRRHFCRCLPTLFRSQWFLGADVFELTAKSRRGYYRRMVSGLRAHVYDAITRIGTPRKYIIRTLPAATASILQHYELWPTPFIDITRSLATAVAFATTDPDATESHLYVFAMPDLRGSITTDMDQHLTLSRLEAVCPPAAKRPHHQDAYLVARAPDPHDLADDKLWDDWESKSNLMRRLVARFRLIHSERSLPGTPHVPDTHLIPPDDDDVFAGVLRQELLPVIKKYIADIIA